ncbi:uncharacterized protein [Prorops nasuta]|uniref:uncharacterized protein n=1 Tax=Prorops nasuta TaxID=863751 RepID=UPI0034CE1841
MKWKMELINIFTLVLFIETIFGYPSQKQYNPDAEPKFKDKAEYNDLVAAASGEKKEYNITNDSEILMEPTEVIKTEQETTAGLSLSEDQELINSDTVLTSGEQEAEVRNAETESQTLFPSFAELFSKHRLSFLEQQQQRYRPNRFLGYFQRDRNAYQTVATYTTKDVQPSLLGSGNFGVIRGGTYYPEEKEEDGYTANESLFNPYYNNDKRNRQNYYGNPKPQPVRSGDFFANFRDFADITSPPKSSFSHLSVVYTNRNGSVAEKVTEPRNIFETLRMLEQDELNIPVLVTTEIPMKKISKGKRKLIKLREYEEKKTRKSRLAVEPLLALS